MAKTPSKKKISEKVADADTRGNDDEWADTEWDREASAADQKHQFAKEQF